MNTALITEQAPATMPINLIFKNADLLAFDKPQGLPCQPLRPTDSDTAAQQAAAQFPELGSIGSPRDLGILYRLDTDTSGLIVFARNPAEWARLRELWTTDAVAKIYRAIAAPASTEEAQVLHSPLPLNLNDPIVHSAKSAKKMIVLLPERRTPKMAIRGKPQPALTQIQSARALSPDHFDLTLQIQAGVRHQIRAHLSAHGLPILGDLLYKGPKSSRLWLHAWKITLPLADGTSLTLEAPLPSDWPKL